MSLPYPLRRKDLRTPMKPDARYIEVAVALPVYTTFTYSAPEAYSDLIATGKRVLVPFGRRRVTGYVFGEGQYLDQKEIKPVLDVLDEKPLFPPSMVAFFRWIADYYKYPIGEVVKNALPGGLNVYDTAVAAITEKGRTALKKGRSTGIAKEILELLQSGDLRVKEIYKKIDQRIPAALFATLEARGWIARKWELRGEITKVRQERFVRPCDTGLPVDHLSSARKKIMAAVNLAGEISVPKLKETVPTAAALLKPLARDGYVTIETRRVYRDPLGDAIQPDTAPVLNPEQQKAVSEVCTALSQGYTTFLLQGVTGSGKTEVYMQIAAEVLKEGRGVLVLVPEIALITQTERRFRARFGECVAVMHSGLSAGERYDQWTRILQGQAAIAIGARSAIFAPFDNLGAIMVDEEHDASYKQEGSLRYNARDLAVVRASQSECVAVLGSATPSVQSYFNVTTRKFKELRLERRVEQRPLPEIRVVDLRGNRDMRGIRRFLAPELILAIKETLERGEQVLLFLNRRGFASFPVCGACGQPVRCKHCDISLTLHQHANAYRCHYCGYSRAATSPCDACGSDKIRRLGLGTEKLESMVTALFPAARVARMDRDTTTRKGSILKILKGLRHKTIDILVGTQMVAKGHDFPNITLVGIVCADLSLNFPDFRSGERTFQLLAQVAGRAGRGDSPGRVILQTYNPEHFSIAAAREQNFKTFYQEEIGFRKALNYPPFSRMIQLKISGRDADKTENLSRLLGERCRALKTAAPETYRTVEVMGPIEASVTRIAERYRWQILLKGVKARALHHFINELLFKTPIRAARQDVQVAIDVDPFFIL